MKQMILGAVVAIVLLAAVTFPRAATGDEDAIRQARDRAEIESLMWRYVRALDTSNADAYAAVYTPDGQFGSGANATKGREALTKMITDLRERGAAAAAKGEPRPPMYHVITQPNIEFVDKDHARYQAYWMTVFGSAGANTPVRVAAAGREYDELVRLNGQWLLKLRDVAPKD